MVRHNESKEGNFIMEWITPKTNWVATDSFNISDYNRIINNVFVVSCYCISRYGGFEIADMGDAIDDDTDYYDVNVFNAIEENIENVSRNLPNVTPTKTTFYENGKFITYGELNRIEGITARFADQVPGWLNGLIRLPMVVGRSRRLPF